MTDSIPPAGTPDQAPEDPHARFTEFFDTYYRQAVTFVHLQAPSADVEEIVANAFVEILTRWTAIGNPRAYLFRTLRNGITKHHRDWRKEARLEARLQERLSVDGPHRSAADPLEGKIAHDDVIAAFQQLPPAMREIAVMSWMLHKPPDQVAEELGKSRSTVTTQLTHAARRLQEFFGTREEER
ncbi:RNA polymerase sigma factor [Streptomyces phaeolivaceus]|uniref:RNA polymerase sigma factor n=1 Tax=Streptomyces phaeolivaceus TaxID=2653200 RepID=UPI001869BC53|nr:sigma-70 family RNA polymerase sigma factor [Streptomyces phaeolivaceus]